MADFGACVECGSWSELRLPPRFPHVCAECLFRPSEDQQQRRDEIRRLGLPLPSMVEDLLSRNVAIGAIRPEERRTDG